jgi:two-component system NtrC family sensor kinase
MKAFAHPSSDTQALADLNESIRNTVIVADGHIAAIADLILALDPHLPPVLCNLAGTLAIRTRTESTPDGPHAAAVIEIQDSGTGIPDHITDRIFDQFFTTKPIGTGTTFTIRLPIGPEIPPTSSQSD